MQEMLALHSQNINGLMENQFALVAQVQVLQAALASTLMHQPGTGCRSRGWHPPRDDQAGGAACQPPPSAWMSATAAAWRSACSCTRLRRAFWAVTCALTTSVKPTCPAW
jgi:hypothetical protein